MKKFILYLYVGITLSILLLESFLIRHPLPFDSRFLLFGFIILLLLLRLANKQIINNKIKKINYFFLVFLTQITFTLLFLENSYGFLFIQDQFGLSYSRVFYLTLASASLALYQSSFKMSKKYIKKILFVLPVYLFLAALFLFVRNNSLFRLIVQEDHLIEYSQFFLLLGSCYITFMLGKYWWRKEKLLSVVFFLASVLFLFVAGEEISWGQRLLGIATPESVAEKNIQDELTLHNYGSVFGLVYRGYILIGFYGSTAWIFFRFIKHTLSQRLKIIAANIVPGWYLSPYFAAACLYNLDRFYLRHEQLELVEKLWEEPVELLLILGITIFLVVKYSNVYEIRFSLNSLLSKKELV